MTNLTEKFTLLETQLADNHTAMMSSLGTIASRMLWDSGEDTFTMAQLQYLCLLQLQEIKYSNDSIVTHLANIYARQGFQGSTFNDMSDYLSEMNDNLNGVLQRLGVAVDTDNDVISLLASLKTGIAALNTAMGIPSGDATTTMLGRLTAIENCGCRPVGAQPPINGPCATPYASCSIAFIPWVIVGGTNVNVAKWCEPLPDGLEYGTTLGLSDDTTELVATDGWDGWHIFVSSAATVFGKSPLDLERYPTNTWLPLSGSDVLSVATDERNSLKVYLCPPADSPAECVTLSSVEITAPWGGTFQGIDWTDSGLPCVDTGPTGTFSGCIFSTNDLTEWSVITIYENVHMNMSGHDGHTDFVVLEASTLTTITGPTPYLHFYKPDGDFAITICPPEG